MDVIVNQYSIIMSFVFAVPQESFSIFCPIWTISFICLIKLDLLFQRVEVPEFVGNLLKCNI